MPAASLPVEPTMKRFTFPEFNDLYDSCTADGRRAMLIDGVIYEEGRETPRQEIVRSKVARLFFKLDPPGHTRQRMALHLSANTVVIPDVMLVPGDIEDYAKHHPITASLVVEVAEFSLAFDTTVKLVAYATAGVPDYWVLDVDGRELHVFRDPQGGAYAQHAVLKEADTAAPLAAPAAVVRVADLLPLPVG